MFFKLKRPKTCPVFPEIFWASRCLVSLLIFYGQNLARDSTPFRFYILKNKKAQNIPGLSGNILGLQIVW
jgi:hypothetical protein